jgi:hypothetical protein
MRSLVLSGMIVVLAGNAFAQTSYHRGYIARNGTVVQPHYQTMPDSSRLNNWSTQGNVNPYTGREGTVNPYAPRNVTPTVPSYPAMPSYPATPYTDYGMRRR